ncbi:MAG: efflux RND transporter periplasmic adaptor subunit [Cyclobacteriaceae bacterium]|nr:efflux RND transporter periplasmic adaptor subunit [Cyclobacteriaceae bacterium]
MKKVLSPLVFIMVILLGCNNGNHKYDASGTFEATETIISAEANGKIMTLTVNEGDVLEAGEQLGYIDSTQLHLTKLQLLQSQKAILSGKPDIKAQLEALQRELENALSDKKRIENLVKGDVASQKQLDDATTRIAVIEARIAAQKSALTTTTTTLSEQSQTIAVQLAQVEDQLKKCKIINPIQGTVLATYAQPYEMISAGRPIYKIADLSAINLKAYISSDQFINVKLGQTVKVLVDAQEGGVKTYEGTVEWIKNI